MSFLTAHQQLDARLLTVVGLPTIQKENTRVKLGDGKTAWCRSSLLPAATVQETVGVNGYNKLHGLFQVDLFYPADGEYATVYGMVDTILGKFVAGTKLTDVLIKNSYAMSGQTLTSVERTMPNYYMVSVMIEWEIYKQRPTIT